MAFQISSTLSLLLLLDEQVNESTSKLFGMTNQMVTPAELERNSAKVTCALFTMKAAPTPIEEGLQNRVIREKNLICAAEGNLESTKEVISTIEKCCDVLELHLSNFNRPKFDVLMITLKNSAKTILANAQHSKNGELEALKKSLFSFKTVSEDILKFFDNLEYMERTTRPFRALPLNLPTAADSQSNDLPSFSNIDQNDEEEIVLPMRLGKRTHSSHVAGDYVSETGFEFQTSTKRARKSENESGHQKQRQQEDDRRKTEEDLMYLNKDGTGPSTSGIIYPFQLGCINSEKDVRDLLPCEDENTASNEMMELDGENEEGFQNSYTESPVSFETTDHTSDGLSSAPKSPTVSDSKIHGVDSDNDDGSDLSDEEEEEESQSNDEESDDQTDENDEMDDSYVHPPLHTDLHACPADPSNKNGHFLAAVSLKAAQQLEEFDVHSGTLKKIEEFSGCEITSFESPESSDADVLEKHGNFRETNFGDSYRKIIENKEAPGYPDLIEKYKNVDSSLYKTELVVNADLKKKPSQFLGKVMNLPYCLLRNHEKTRKFDAKMADTYLTKIIKMKDHSQFKVRHMEQPPQSFKDNALPGSESVWDDLEVEIENSSAKQFMEYFNSFKGVSIAGFSAMNKPDSTQYDYDRWEAEILDQRLKCVNNTKCNQSLDPKVYKMEIEVREKLFVRNLPQIKALNPFPTFLKCEKDEQEGMMDMAKITVHTPCTRNYAQLEKHGLATAVLNAGPGDMEWTVIPFEFTDPVRKLLADNDLTPFRKAWPLEKDFGDSIPRAKFLQKKGEVVFLNTGAYAWSQSTGFTTTLTWKVACKTMTQLHSFHLFRELSDDQETKDQIDVLLWKAVEKSKAALLGNKVNVEKVKDVLKRSLEALKMRVGADAGLIAKRTEYLKNLKCCRQQAKKSDFV